MAGLLETDPTVKFQQIHTHTHTHTLCSSSAWANKTSMLKAHVTFRDHYATIAGLADWSTRKSVTLIMAGFVETEATIVLGCVCSG